MSRAYYNENDPFAAQWIRNLITARLIADGEVDERSIVDVRAEDLKGFTQCHFFAGIGGWSYALRLAGWPDDRPVWTGSCPCQPFSVAGRQTGFSDKRHLWPEFKRLISQRSPSRVLGEQSAAATKWLGIVRSDLETLGYAVGAIPMEAASAGADHYRDRFWFVADYNYSERRADNSTRHHAYRKNTGWAQAPSNYAKCRSGSVEHLTSNGWGEGWAEDEFRRRGFSASVASFYGKQFVECSDGKWRALPPPRVRWLGDGVPARIHKLRGLGNAIDPRPAAQFIGAVMECIP